MKIIRFIAGLLCACSLLSLPSCNSTSSSITLGNWRQAAAFSGIPRAGAIAFAIGDIAYVGLGYDGTYYRNDFYSYDRRIQTWVKRAPFPGVSREKAVAFSIGGKGYVGTGYNRDSAVQLGDFWEYDPALNSWKRLADFGGDPRSSAVGFSDGTYGYVGTGYNIQSYADFYQYNPIADSWTNIITYRSTKRSGAMTMTIKGKTYLFGGTNNGSYTYDIWEFDPTHVNDSLAWTNRTPLSTDAQYNNFKAAVNRSYGCAFSLNNLGYITCGSNGSVLNTTWQYDPSNQNYTQMTSFEGASRQQAVSFVIGDEQLGFKAFVATGLQSATFDDMMEFRPRDQYVLND